MADCGLVFSTQILGHNFSAPFFISPCARGGYGHPEAELNLVKGAAAGDILYMVRRSPQCTNRSGLVLISGTY